MAIRSQLIKQFGFKEETTWGTAVTVDKFLPIVDFENSGGPEKTYSEAIISGKLTHEYGYTGSGNETYEFDVGGELYDHAMTTLLKLMLGAVATTGAGPYTHTITQAEPLPSFTAQVAAPDESGVVRALTFAGSVFNAWEIAVEAGKRATWSGSANAKSETNATAAATLAYAASLVPVHSQNATLSLLGSSVLCKSFKLSGEYDNTYDERRFLGSTQIGARQVNQDLRAYKAELVLELTDNFVQYLKFKNDNTGSTALTITVGSNTTTITLPTSRLVEGPPKFTGRGVIEQPLTVEGLGWNAFEPITLVCVNSDATA